MTREEAREILKIKRECYDYEGFSCDMPYGKEIDGFDGCQLCEKALDMAIEALEKQIPMKVEWTIDHIWGTTRKQPVCPVCDYYLTMTEFIGNGEKITYCDHCGQAIDWSEDND